MTEDRALEIADSIREWMGRLGPDQSPRLAHFCENGDNVEVVFEYQCLQNHPRCSDILLRLEGSYYVWGWKGRGCGPSLVEEQQGLQGILEYFTKGGARRLVLDELIGQRSP